MTPSFKFVSAVLALTLSFSAPKAFCAEQVVSRSEMAQAMSKSLAQEDASRSAITSLLQRDDVQSLAGGYGLDMRRAEAAVGTLQGDDLKRVAALAASADQQLVGGAQRITISLVALLLIVIIVILIAS